MTQPVAKDYYVGWVMDRLPCLLNPGDFAATHEAVEQCYDDGFSMDDALSYCRNLEHVNPDLDEEIALTRMHQIAAKYPNRRHQPKSVQSPPVPPHEERWRHRYRAEVSIGILEGTNDEVHTELNRIIGAINSISEKVHVNQSTVVSIFQQLMS